MAINLRVLNRSIVILCALLLLPAVASTQEQEKKDASLQPARPALQESPEARLPNDFLGLADLRATTNSDIASLEKEGKEIEEKTLPYAQANQARLGDLKNKIAGLEKLKQRSVREQTTLETARAELDFVSTQSFGADPQKLQQRLGAIQQLLQSKRSLAGQIQSKIASMLSPEQAFKRTMSITFACLIAVVIVGFFIITGIDEKIRQQIFSSETGIQFVTLFSLVIAIILFGITQILEGKELSALLGGLSGYILGRTVPKTP